MNFAQPNMLWLMLALVPALALFLGWGYRRKQFLIRQFVQHKMLAQLTLGVSQQRQKIRIVLLVLAVTFLVFALARPQWGFGWEETAQRGRDIVVAIDASKSMLASDLQPNRLARAKLAALDLLKLAKNDRLGLVAFAGSAFLQCPLTLDDEAYRQSIEVLNPGILPQGGTAISEAVDAALGAFSKEEGENHKVMILFTDGEDHTEGIQAAISKASSANLKIFTVGVGTPAGEVIRTPDDRGKMQFLRDDSGNVVKSRLNEKLLQEIASGTSGFYLPLRGANTMKELYDRGLASLPTTEFEARLVKRYREQFAWPLSIAILLLIVEALLPDQTKPRSRTVVSAGNSPLKLATLITALTCPAILNASPATAMRNLNEGSYKEALSEYKRLLEKKPDDLRLHYNAGVAAYGAHDYEQAMRNFGSAAGADDLELQQRAYYNMGNAQFRAGEANTNPQEKIASWEQALKNYDSSLKLNGADADARYNRELVVRKIEELKKQQQQQKDHKQDKNDKKDQEKKDDQQDQKQQENKDQQQQEQSKDQEKKDSEQQKQDQQKQQDQKQQQEEQQQEEQNQADQEEKKPGDDKSDQQSAGQDQQEQEPPSEQEEREALRMGRMSPAQAKQLLDAQKDDEKALIFLPPDAQQKKRRPGIFKDW